MGRREKSQRVRGIEGASSLALLSISSRVYVQEGYIDPTDVAGRNTFRAC